MSSDRFAPRAPRDVLQLVLSQPLAWVVSGVQESFRATLLPVRPEVDADEHITHLVGHFARSNDHHRLIAEDGRAVILVLGVHGYISPSWMQDKTQAPTWNYASAQFDVAMSLFDEPSAIETHMRDLVDTMEANRADRWSIDQMGPRYRSLSKGVVGFRARVDRVRAKFKLGQDERDDVFADITAALTREPDQQLLSWMRQFNSTRS